MAITIKNEEEIELMKKSGQILARVHADLAKELREGMTTKEIDRLAHEMIFDYGGIPNFLNYNGFPASVCVSINEEVVHGIPSDKRFLRSGDIVSIDGGVLFEGYHSDAARTYGIGEVSEEARKLIEVTEESFFEALKKARPGNHIVDIGKAVQTYALHNGYSVVRDLTGHGIGTQLHEAPNIPNYKTFFRGPRLRKGMTLAVEPMINLGNYSVTRLEDNWTYATTDGTLSAHYENTIAITDTGCEILTMLPEEQELKFAGYRRSDEPQGDIREAIDRIPDEFRTSDFEERPKETIIVSSGKKSADGKEESHKSKTETKAKEDAQEPGTETEAEDAGRELRTKTEAEDAGQELRTKTEAEENDQESGTETVAEEEAQESDENHQIPEAESNALEEQEKVPYSALSPEEKRARRDLLFEDD